MGAIKIMKKLKNNQEGYAADYLVIGTGNIALRHIDNIINMSNKKSIYVCKRFGIKLNRMLNEKDIHIVDNLKNIYPKSKKSIAVICSAASNHVADAVVLARKGFNIFLEKPLTTHDIKINKLIKICNDNKLKTLVGYNMRFTNRIKSIFNIIKNRKYGAIKEIDICVETDFRKWRKGLNYKDSVSFNKDLGGGVINELSHEIDYLYLLFGKPSKVMVNNNTIKDSQYNIETHIIATFEYSKNMPIVRMNLNMISTKEKRYCKIYFEKSTIEVNHIMNSLMIKTGKQEKLKIFKDKINDSYVRELNDLIKSIENNTTSKLTIEECKNTQFIINAMQKSLKSNKTEAISQ